MSGLPNPTGAIEDAKAKLRAAVRGDDQWLDGGVLRRGTEGDMFEGPAWVDDSEDEENMNMIAPTPKIYKHAHAFLGAVFGEDKYTPDAVAQLVDAFVPCLRIMIERDYRPNGATWQRAGRKGLVRELLKYTDRLHDRDWLGNTPDRGSAEDMVNYAGMYMRACKDGLDNWGFWGEPAREGDDA